MPKIVDMTRRDGPGGRSRGKSVLVSVREKPTSGFTLIELMMVIVIVAVLTMIAYPAYQSFTVKANRAEAQSYLMDVAQKQQLYFNDTRTYAADEAELNVTTPDAESFRRSEAQMAAMLARAVSFGQRNL